MISVTEAKEMIGKHCTVLHPVTTPLANAFSKILAEDIFSPIDIPNYLQSSMDGYAFNYEGYLKNKQLKIIGEITAGDQKNINIKPDETVRIFTGAPVPHGADTVMMQEKTFTENGLMFIEEENFYQGNSIRNKGLEITAGALALEKNSLLTAGAIGFLASLGIAEVSVYPSPKVCIIVTGNELQTPGNQLAYGQVFEANSFSLNAALQFYNIDDVRLLFAKDNIDELTNILQDALSNADLVLLTGGVSVGDYDFVVQAAENCGIEKVFHKIKQKPGKPLFFGKKNNKIIFGLPGNPSSVLTCFYQYVVPAIQIMMNKNEGLKKKKAPLKNAFSKALGLTHFLKGHYDGINVNPLSAQESFRMSSFAKANCIIEIDENIKELNAGEEVTVYLLSEY